MIRKNDTMRPNQLTIPVLWSGFLHLVAMERWARLPKRNFGLSRCYGLANHCCLLFDFFCIASFLCVIVSRVELWRKHPGKNASSQGMARSNWSRILYNRLRVYIFVCHILDSLIRRGLPACRLDKLSICGVGRSQTCTWIRCGWLSSIIPSVLWGGFCSPASLPWHGSSPQNHFNHSSYLPDSHGNRID
ncbi:hypothetical protein BJX70DRAFT_221562 [Aspergillus crustosus]